MTTVAYEDRIERFSDMEGVRHLRELDIGIAGVGAVGRQIAMSLAAMGADNVSIYDHDRVSPSNCGTQGYAPRDVGYAKVAACLGAAQTLNPGALNWKAHSSKYPIDNLEQPHTVLFLGMDTMSGRLKAVKKGPPAMLLIDTRMAIRTGRIVADAPPFKYWKKTYFPDSKGLNAPCTRKATFFNSAIVGNWAVAFLMDWLASNPPPRDLQIETLGHFAAQIEESNNDSSSRTTPNDSDSD
jgi:sulfur carrier protein ThiS adenylyltransferase